MARNEAFDRLTELAASLFQAPIALITAVDDERQWFRSNRGYGADQTARHESFCRHMIGQPAGSTLTVPDATLDPRFVANRLVAEEGVRFYAGAVITTSDGHQDGAVCVIDTVSREVPTAGQMESLKLLAQLAGQEIDNARLVRRQAEHTAMLEMSEAMAGVGHWRYDVVTEKITWSDEVYRIHGLEPQSIEPKMDDLAGLYHADDLIAVRALMARTLETGQGYDTRLRAWRGADERVTRVNARAELDEDGRPVAIFGVFQDITEMVRAQSALETSEARYRMLAETATDIVTRFDPTGKFLYVSPSVRHVLGREPDQMLGKDCTGIIPEEDLAVIRETLTAYVAAGPEAAPPRYEYRALKADGSPLWLEATPRAIRDERGRLVEFHDCVRDITARKAAEQARQELLDTLKLAEALAGLGSWKLDAITGQVRWSDQVYRIHGVDPWSFDPSLDDAVDFYHPDDRQAVRDWCANAIETGEGGEFRLRLIRADGEERIVVSQCRPERREGRTVALYGVFQDVTERVRAEDVIRTSEARYRLLADNSTDVIAVYGLDGVFRYLSPAIEGPMGFKAEELVGRPFSAFMHPDDVEPVRKAFLDYARAAADTPSPRIPYRAIRKDGQTVWLEAHPRLIRDDQGRGVEFQDVVRDITETKALEDELIAAKEAAENAVKTKSEFLANMSHELRTPLTSVIGFSGLLQDSEALPEAERRYADRIATASEALLCVINDILDYSKLEAEAVGLDPRPFDPAEMARGAAGIVEAQCAAKGVGLVVEVDPTLPSTLMGDAGRLRQVLLNFLSNAAKFTMSGEVRVAIGWREDRMRIAVSDTGIGIAADKIDTLFERFTQADASTTRVYGGTGLGLAISRRLIEMMGGEIGATSRPGEGSTFWFEVPLPVAEVASAVETSAGMDLPAGLRVLMADDAPANRELVRIILQGWEVDLTTVENGAEAVQAAAGGAFDLVLMDVHMPVMDGMDATRAIRALPGSVGRVPILALTANVQPEQIGACRAAGMDAHVGKPIEVVALIEAMVMAINDTRRDRDGEKVA